MAENLTRVTVSLGGKKHSVSLAAATLGALRDAIAEPPLSLPRPEPHRLIAGSLRLDGGDDTPLPAPRRAGMPLVVLAVRSGAADVAPINHIARLHENRAQNLPVARPQVRSKPEASPFSRIAAIGGRKRTAEAQAMLERVATDPGVLAVMKRRSWRVGALLELPEIESDSSKLLGLNKNRGAEILLRLTFDAGGRVGDGLRSYASIIDTMLHELVHIEIGPHNRDFHALHRVLKDEYAEALRWPSGAASSAAAAAAASSAPQGRAWVGGSGALGGGNSNNTTTAATTASTAPGQRTPAQMAALAALGRLSEHEQRLVDACGNDRDAGQGGGGDPGPSQKS